MGTGITVWQIGQGGELTELATSMAAEGRKEVDDLHAWLRAEPGLLGRDVLLIGHEVATNTGPIDLLGIDSGGQAVVIEVKRDHPPREALAQAIDYASQVAMWSQDRLDALCQEYTELPLEDALEDRFGAGNWSTDRFTDPPRILIVATASESSLERMVEWLADSVGMAVNMVVITYAKTSSGEELLATTSVIPETVAEARGRRRGWVVDMSDEPGQHDDDALRQRLAEYLGKKRRAPTLIRTVLLPACLDEGVIGRERLTELVSHAAGSEGKRPGTIVATLSKELGLAANDFLRQVITYTREGQIKDDYRIRDGCEDLVREVLAGLGEPPPPDEA
jgi:hypothetical protein